MVDALRIAFFGTPAFAVPTLVSLVSSPHQVVAVFTQPDKPRGRGQKVSGSPVKVEASAEHIPVFQPTNLRDPAVAATLADLRLDLAVIAAYGKLIPDALLAVPRLGMINVHASLLPTFRGAAPVHRAVIAGDAETGVTIMRVIRELDAGGMFAKVTRPIGPDETSDVVERDLADIGAALLVQVVDDLAQGTAHETPQDPSRATYATRLTKEEGLIDWSSSAKSIHDRVRGLHPWPHAYSFVNGHRIIVLRTRNDGVRTDAAAGSVIEANNDGIRVATGDGHSITIDELQSEGRRPMKVRDFLAGHPVDPGAVFGRP